jgi:hypothetical protein
MSAAFFSANGGAFRGLGALNGVLAAVVRNDAKARPAGDCGAQFGLKV